MLFAVHLEDDPGKVELRERCREAHQAYLEANAGQLRLAGSLAREGSRIAVGGLWIVQAASELEVRRLVEEDPLWQHGLRRAVRIWRWRETWPGSGVGSASRD